MKLLKTPAIIILSIALLISCSFSTTGGISYKSPYQIETETKQNTKPAVFKVDTSSKAPYMVIKKPSEAEVKRRDSMNRAYIGSIVQPYINDLKNYHNQSITSIMGVIDRNSNNLDSLSKLRIKEGRLFESNAVNRYEENYRALLESNKSNDSLKTLIVDLNQNFHSFTSSIYKIFGYIKVFSGIMSGIMVLILLTIVFLQIFIYIKKKQYNLI